MKPEPHNEIPQAADRARHVLGLRLAAARVHAHADVGHVATARSRAACRMMEGFGVHTFRLVNAEGEARSSSSTGSPSSASHSLVWDEAAEDRRRATPTSTAATCGRRSRPGDFPEWELGVQLFAEEDEPTGSTSTSSTPPSSSPRSWSRCGSIGRMVLDRNPDNFFAETEQVAFCTANVVPGIDFSNDPLLQGRQLLLPGHPAEPPRRPELHPAARSTGPSPRSATTSGTATASRRSTAEPATRRTR